MKHFIILAVIAALTQGCMTCSRSQTETSVVGATLRQPVMFSTTQTDGWIPMAFDSLAQTVVTNVTIRILGKEPYIRIPAELRNRNVDARVFVESAASAVALRVLWMHDGESAIIYCPAEPQVLADIKRDIYSDDLTVRKKAFMDAAFLDDPAVFPILKAAAGDSDPAISFIGFAGLSRLKWDVFLECDVGGWNLVADAAKHTNGAIQVAAIEGLGRAKSERAVTVLENTLNACSQDMQSTVIRALGSTGRTSALHALEVASSNTALNMWVRFDAETALQSFPSRESVAVFTKRLNAASDNRRREAVCVLGRIGGVDAINALKIAARDRSSIVRAAALEALFRLKVAGTDSLLAEALDDTGHDVREVAARVMAKDGNSRAISILQYCMKSESSEERTRAVAALGRASGKKGLEMLAIAISDKSTEVRMAAARSLGGFGEPAALSLLERLADDDASNVKEAVIYALRGTDGAQATRILKMLAQDRNSFIRDRALANLPDSAADGEIRALFENATCDSDFHVRSTAYMQLTRQLKPPEAVELWAKALYDSDEIVSEGAAKSLAVLGIAGEASAWKALEKGLYHSNSSVRNGTIAGLKWFENPEVFALLKVAISNGPPDACAAAVEHVGSIGFGGNREAWEVFIGAALNSNLCAAASHRMSDSYFELYSCRDPVSLEMTLSLLERAIQSDSSCVRQSAASVCSSGVDVRGQFIVRYLAILDKASRDPDPDVRCSAVRSAAWMFREAGILMQDRLFEIVVKGMNDHHKTPREEAYMQLVSLGSNQPELMPRLERLFSIAARDPDQNVRSEASVALESLRKNNNPGL